MSILPIEFNIDLDSLFKASFTYNFDILKHTIDGLIKNQVGLYKNIYELSNQNKDKDNLIQNLIKELKGNGLIKDFNEAQYQNSNPDIIVTLGNCDNNNTNKDNNNNGNSNYNPSNSKRGSKANININDSITKSLLYDIDNKLEALAKKTLDHDKDLNEINSKLKDISILELFKNTSDEEGEANSTNLLAVINTLDTQTSQKFKSTDERIAKNEEDLFKLKSDVNNLKNTQESHTRTIKSNKDSIDDLANQIGDMKSLYDTLSQKMTEDKQNQIAMIKSLIKEYDDKTLINNNNINDDKTSVNQSSILAGNQQDKEEKSTVSNPINQPLQSGTIEEIYKQIRDMKKQISKLSSSSSDNNGLLKDIHNIKEELNSKCNNTQLKDLTSLVDDLAKKIFYTKDQLNTHTEDSIGHEAIRIIQKKIDLAMGMILQLQSSFDSNNSNSNSTKNQSSLNPLNDPTFLKEYATKYLEIEIFNDFKIILHEKLSYLSDNIAENRKLIEDLSILLKQKAFNRDLKELEEVLLAKIEDLKVGCQKKFADKVEMGKNLKFLDAQIRNILEINIKRTDKGDSWLLAKKPLGGHLCASCETYIGDLKESNAYVPWNKYPIKDSNDKLYRLGNGFSKMLQMVSNDNSTQGDRRDPFASSQDCFSSINYRRDNNSNSNKEGGIEKKKERIESIKEASTPRRDQSLPRLRQNNESASMFSENENVAEENLNLTQEEEEIESKPKIMKIYKKTKKST